MRRVLLLMFLGLAHGAYKLQEQFRWKALDYAYPTEEARRQAIMNGRFIPENNLPVGIEIWNNKLFVTVPRWMAGKLFLILFVFWLLLVNGKVLENFEK